MNTLLESAIWSDRFFNSKQVEGEVGDVFDREQLLDAAKSFVDDNPDCPFAPQWFVNDFLKRV